MRVCAFCCILAVKVRSKRSLISRRTTHLRIDRNGPVLQLGSTLIEVVKPAPLSNPFGMRFCHPPIETQLLIDCDFGPRFFPYKHDKNLLPLQLGQ